jgi:hypothetical protein
MPNYAHAIVRSAALPEFLQLGQIRLDLFDIAA